MMYSFSPCNSHFSIMKPRAIVPSALMTQASRLTNGCSLFMTGFLHQVFKTVVQRYKEAHKKPAARSHGAAAAPLQLLHLAGHHDAIVVAAEVRHVANGVKRRLLLVDKNARLQALEAAEDLQHVFPVVGD